MRITMETLALTWIARPAVCLWWFLNFYPQRVWYSVTTLKEYGCPLLTSRWEDSISGILSDFFQGSFHATHGEAFKRAESWGFIELQGTRCMIAEFLCANKHLYVHRSYFNDSFWYLVDLWKKALGGQPPIKIDAMIPKEGQQLWGTIPA